MTNGPPEVGDAKSNCPRCSKHRWAERAARWSPTLITLAAHLVELLNRWLP